MVNDGDWWVCPACSSLNDLAARRCYSCHAKKGRRAIRLSDLEAFRIVESWDGKLRYLPRVIRRDREAAEAGPSSIRPPLRRHITDLAPRPPEGARIVYRHEPRLQRPPPPSAPRYPAPPATPSPQAPPPRPTPRFTPQAPPLGPTPPPAPLARRQIETLGREPRVPQRPKFPPRAPDHPSGKPAEPIPTELDTQSTGPWPRWEVLTTAPGTEHDDENAATVAGPGAGGEPATEDSAD